MHTETGSFDPLPVVITIYQSRAKLRLDCDTKPESFAGFLCGLSLPTLEYREIPTRCSWRRRWRKYPMSSRSFNGFLFYRSRPCSFSQASAEIGRASCRERV